MSAPVRHTWRAAVVQFCATADVSANLETCRSLLRVAKGKGAEFAFFPEASDFVSPGNGDTVRLTHQAGGFLGGLAEEAKRLGLWVGVGVHEKSSDPARVYNSHMLISGTTGEESELVAPTSVQSVPEFLRCSQSLAIPAGEVIAAYRKLHLFDVICDPWGRIVASCPARGAAPAVEVADISYAELDRVRRAMTVLQHRRVDIFPEPIPVPKATIGVAEEHSCSLQSTGDHGC